MKQESGPTNNPVQLRAEDLDNLKELNEAFISDLRRQSDSGAELMAGLCPYLQHSANLIAQLEAIEINKKLLGEDFEDLARRKTAVNCLAMIIFLCRFLSLNYGINARIPFESGDIGKAASELIEKFGIDIMPEGGGPN